MFFFDYDNTIIEEEKNNSWWNTCKNLISIDGMWSEKVSLTPL